MPAAASSADNVTRAVDAYNAMQTYFYQASMGLYREHYPPDTSLDQPYGYVWSFEEATKATLHMFGLPGVGSQYARAVQDRLTARERYWDGNARRRGYRSYPATGDRYYDDNSWVGSDLLQHHLMTSTAESSTALDRAQAVLEFVQSGWESGLPKSGGVRWVDASFNGDRGTGATGGAVKLALHLYDATGRRTASYVEWALQAYDWTKRYLLSPDNGLYWNALRADGEVDADQWIYNQGILVGANVLLHRCTKRAEYLTEAVRLADAALAWFGTDPYFSRGTGAYAGRGIFNAIFFRNLMLLYVVNRDRRYVQTIQAYADAVWDDPTIHDQQTSLFRLNGESRWSLLDQAGMVQLYAMLAWHPSQYAHLT